MKKENGHGHGRQIPRHRGEKEPHAEGGGVRLKSNVHSSGSAILERKTEAKRKGGWDGLGAGAGKQKDAKEKGGRKRVKK